MTENKKSFAEKIMKQKYEESDATRDSNKFYNKKQKQGPEAVHKDLKRRHKNRLKLKYKAKYNKTK